MFKKILNHSKWHSLSYRCKQTNINVTSTNTWFKKWF